MSVTTQLATMLAMIGMGSWLGAALDTYNRFLQRQNRKHWVVFINDVLFWIVQGLIIFYVLLLVNEGELRFYIFLAVLCGYAAYQSLFRMIYLRVLEWVISLAVRLYRFFIRLCYYLIVRPVQLLLQTLLMLSLFIWNVFLFVLRILYQCVKILFAPVRWIGFMVWRRIPQNWKETLKNFFRYLAGIIRPVKNMIVKWVLKWRK
ncbi:spore cortex biosynthesis protein YabQ [Parageobacillus thermoglucosidasius]|uniref:Spore cortex biosynthesis protein YabQ n=1 Tax=Parageobacillus thermoglucosidasius TaxID=1426 RepID=A0AAN0YMQ7_PARTM|nr:spore cortex biosynthesis protein YabQ [Parageobacillus thermoglucosidasius]AEH46137.1 spore cortex biosynthesis protein YabQ [Parageobacillus thermoglucosidasius C56-YS93]ALF09030.1 spore coat protein [Parageobacillus thermoglucosidasius]ANZ29111.1 spore cortex biosynthesis protein YabQ [Parageobacillus thermoglucosidasius]APM79850.1 spore cortex biosynthesis protein YabQ [Parageobacillus thermoglucosidasius]KJX67793.1 spore coat protein [Parageobacillus thermoglucosidasius]